MNPSAEILNSSEELSNLVLSSYEEYDIEIYNEGEAPFEISAITVASQNVEIHGSGKTTISFISELTTVTIGRLSFNNVNVTFSYASGPSAFIFDEGDFEAFNSTLLGKFSIQTKNCIGDMITLSKIGKIESEHVDIYANEPYYDFAPNHYAILQFGSLRKTVHVHGFTQDTFATLTNSELKINFVKTNATLHLNNSQFTIITTQNNTMMLNRMEASSYLSENLVLVINNGAKVKFNEYSNLSMPIKLESTRGGSIEFFNSIKIQNLFVMIGKFSIKHSSNMTIQSVSLIESSLILSAGDYDPVFNSIVLTGKSLISRPSTTGKLNIAELHMNDVPNINPFEDFYL